MRVDFFFLKIQFHYIIEIIWERQSIAFKVATSRLSTNSLKQSDLKQSDLLNNEMLIMK